MTRDQLLLMAACVAIVVLLVLLIRAWFRYRRLRKRFEPVLDVEQELKSLQAQRKSLDAEVTQKRRQWKSDFAQALAELEATTSMLDQARFDLEMQSFGLYRSRYDFGSADKYKERLDRIRNKQKQLIKAGKAAYCPIEWEVEGASPRARR